MAAQTTTASESHDKHAKTPLVVVELAKRRTSDQIKRLRKGRGKLAADIDEVVGELIAAGTVKANAQPVVIVVKEATSLPWPLSAAQGDDEEDEEGEHEHQHQK